MEFRVLGRVTHDGGEGTVAPRGRLGRTFLAMLLARADTRVPVDVLADALWPDEPGPATQQRLQLHASRLRTQLDDGSRLSFEDGAYRLRVAPGELDAQRFEALAAEADRSGDPEQRAALTEEALALWHGDPYGGLDVPALVEAARRLEERRLDVLEAHHAAEIDCGRHAAVTGRLAELARRHPLREGVHALLITALHRSGRPAEALAAYQEARSVMVEELGLEPGPGLQRLHARILEGEGDTHDEARDAPIGSRETWTPPRRLPIAPAGFTGRTEQLASLDTLLGGRDGAGILVALHGGGGVGKTSLALHWAHRVADRFPDGQLFVNLRGHGPTDPRSPAEALDILLRGLGVEPARIPANEDDRAAMFRDELAGRRLLLLLDNARDSAQIRPLLPGGDHTVLVTSRSQLRNLVTHDGARRVRVEPMSREEAVGLLAERIGRRSRAGAGSDHDQLADLAALCGHLPIALAVVAERAERYERRPLAELAAELRGGRSGRTDPLGGLTAWEEDPATSVRAVLSWSYDALDAVTARQFRLLGLHPYPAFDVHVASWVAGNPLSETARALDRLVDAHLLAESTPGVFEMHDLVRAFATELAHTDPGEDERTATGRMRSGYLHTTALVRELILKRHDWLDPGAPPVDAPPVPLDGPGAIVWIRDNQLRLLSVISDAADFGDHAFVEGMVGQLNPLFRAVGSHDMTMRLLELGLRSATRAGDPRAEGTVRACLGRALLLQDRFDDALQEVNRAVTLLRSAGADAALMTSLRDLGLVLTHVDPEAAIAPFNEAMPLAEKVGHTAPLHNNLAYCHLTLGRLEEARAAAEAAVSASREEGDGLLGYAFLLDTLGEVETRRGQYEDACAHLSEALAIARGMSTAGPDQAEILKHLGSARLGLGDVPGARASWQEALLVLDRSGASDSKDISRDGLRQLIADLDDVPAADR